MSQTSSPARPQDPARRPQDPSRGVGTTQPGFAGRGAPGPDSSAQLLKLAALAVALVVLAVLLFFLFAGPTSEQSTAPEEKEYTEEEEATDEPPAPAPAPPAMADDRRPSSPRPSGGGGAANDATPPPALPPLHLLSVGYSPLPALRVVALRIGGALPYFLHEGDTIGDIKILAILSDRVQISHKGKHYEIRVGADGKAIGLPTR